MRIDLPAILSFAHNYIVGIPVAFVFVLMSYLAVVGLALSKKDEVEASVWHGDTGFAIKARSRQPPRARRPDTEVQQNKLGPKKTAG